MLCAFAALRDLFTGSQSRRDAKKICKSVHKLPTNDTPREGSQRYPFVPLFGIKDLVQSLTLVGTPKLSLLIINY